MNLHHDLANAIVDQAHTMHCAEVTRTRRHKRRCIQCRENFSPRIFNIHAGLTQCDKCTRQLYPKWMLTGLALVFIVTLPNHTESAVFLSLTILWLIVTLARIDPMRDYPGRTQTEDPTPG